MHARGKQMYVINLYNREARGLEVERYATFATAEEAVAFVRAHEREFRRLGWYSVIDYI